MANTVASFRENGLNQDIHIFTDDNISGRCDCYDGTGINIDRGFEQLVCLKSGMSKIVADVFIWIAPGTMLRYCPKSIPGTMGVAPLYVPLHFGLESIPSGLNAEVMRIRSIISIFRKRGVLGSIYYSEDDFWMIRRDAIDTLVSLTREFRDKCRSDNIDPDWAITLGFCMHMFGANLRRMLTSNKNSLWSSDLCGSSEAILLDQEWRFSSSFIEIESNIGPPFVRGLKTKCQTVGAP